MMEQTREDMLLTLICTDNYVYNVSDGTDEAQIKILTSCNLIETKEDSSSFVSFKATQRGYYVFSEGGYDLWRLRQKREQELLSLNIESLKDGI